MTFSKIQLPIFVLTLLPSMFTLHWIAFAEIWLARDMHRFARGNARILPTFQSEIPHLVCVACISQNSTY
jgi:hypothetical protein